MHNISIIIIYSLLFWKVGFESIRDCRQCDEMLALKVAQILQQDTMEFFLKKWQTSKGPK